MSESECCKAALGRRNRAAASCSGEQQRTGIDNHSSWNGSTAPQNLTLRFFIRPQSSTVAALGQKLAAANLSLWTDMQRQHRIETSSSTPTWQTHDLWGLRAFSRSEDLRPASLRAPLPVTRSSMPVISLRKLGQSSAALAACLPKACRLRLAKMSHSLAGSL